MITFEGEYKSLKARIFSRKNFAFVFILIFYSYILFHFFEDEDLKYYAYFLEFALFILCITLAINTFRSIINIVIIDENKITLKGENFNNEWEKSLPLKGTRIEAKGNPCRTAICGVTFYIKLKNGKNNYTINSFQTFSDEQIIEIFNEFKNYKGEKIIIDEKLYIMRIQEKIEKCQ